MPRGKISADATEKLINVVRDKPFLYDTSLKEYKDSILSTNAWDSVASALKFEGMTGEDWKKKWRNLRDTYIRRRRESRTKKSGQATGKKVKWHYFDIMNFLDPYTEENCTQSNMVMDDVDLEDVSFEDIVSQCSTDQDVSQQVSEDEDTRPSTSFCDSDGVGSHQPNSERPVTQERVSHKSKRKTPRKAKSQDNVDQAIIELLEERKRRPQEKSVQDEDILYFNSCALRYKQFNQTQKGLFQIKMAQLFFDIENTLPVVNTTAQPSASTPTYTSLQTMLPRQMYEVQDTWQSNDHQHTSNLLAEAMGSLN